MMRFRLLSILLLLSWAGAAAAAQPLSGEALLEHEKAQLRRLGDVYYSRGGYWNAYEKYSRLVGKGEEEPLILYRLGYSARQLRRQDEAREWFTRAAKAYEARTAGEGATLGDFYFLASTLSYLQDGVALEKISAKALDLARKGKFGKDLSGADLFQLSRLNGFLGKRDEARRAMDGAIEAYRKAETIDADDLYFSTAMLGRAREMMAGGQYKTAANLYGETLRRRPRTAGALYEMALAQMRAGDWDAAAETWGKARTADPTRATEAGYAHQLLKRLIRYRAENPDAEPLGVESAHADRDRGQLEQEIARLVGAVGEARKKLAEGEGSDELQAASQVSSDPARAASERLEAELAAALLAYHLRGLPTRDLASQYRLLGWIFAK